MVCTGRVESGALLVNESLAAKDGGFREVAPPAAEKFGQGERAVAGHDLAEGKIVELVFVFPRRCADGVE